MWTVGKNGVYAPTVVLSTRARDGTGKEMKGGGKAVQGIVSYTSLEKIADKDFYKRNKKE